MNSHRKNKFSDIITVNELLKQRHDAIALWLSESEYSFNCTLEQRHLNPGSLECVYWHYGYLIALRDILFCLEHTDTKYPN